MELHNLRSLDYTYDSKIEIDILSRPCSAMDPMFLAWFTISGWSKASKKQPEPSQDGDDPRIIITNAKDQLY